MSIEFMDLRLSDEEKLVREAAGQFVDKELLRLEGAFLKQQEAFLPPGDPPQRNLDPDVEKALIEKAKKIGLWALELPEDEGGAGLSHVARLLIRREFGRTALPFEPPPIPSVAAKSEWAKKIAEGKLILSLAFAELHRTASLNDVRSSYRKAAQGYCLNSSGIDVFEPGADLYLLPARAERSGSIGLLLIGKGTPGLSLGDEVEMTSDETVATLILSECKIPEEQLVGGEQDIREIIAEEQLRIAARSLGIGTRCLGDSLEHARNRITFGRPLSSRQAIQWMVADLSVSLRASTWLTLEAAWRADQGLSYFDAAAVAKKRATRMAFEAADIAIQIHGGYGVCKEFPFETFYREARLMRLLYGQEGELDRVIAEEFMSEGVRREAIRMTDDR